MELFTGQERMLPYGPTWLFPTLTFYQDFLFYQEKLPEIGDEAFTAAMYVLTVPYLGSQVQPCSLTLPYKTGIKIVLSSRLILCTFKRRMDVENGT